jgi:RNase P subunit RPR2
VTTERVRAILDENPQQTLRMVAQQVGVTHQRVQQIVQKLGLIQGVTPRRPHCHKCGKPIQYRSKSGMCRSCGKLPDYTFTCEQCGNEKTISGNDYNTRKRNPAGGPRFCDRQCFGQWAGKTYGVGPQRADRDALRDTLLESLEVARNLILVSSAELYPSVVKDIDATIARAKGAQEA